MNKKKLIISFIVIIIDQLIKAIMQINNVNIKVIGSFLKFIYHQNDGAAFGIMSSYPILLIIISIVALIIIYNLTFSYKESKLSNIGFGLLIGGIISNLIDRCIFGFVRDFISFSIFKPIFNIADITIVSGVVIIIFLTLNLKEGDTSGNKSR